MHNTPFTAPSQVTSVIDGAGSARWNEAGSAPGKAV